MAIELKTKYAVTHSNGTTSLSRLDGRSDMSPNEKYLAVISTAGEVCLTIYRIDKQAKTVSVIEKIKNDVLTTLNIQSHQGVKYSPDGKWLLVWSPIDTTGTQCYIYPVSDNGTLGIPQQIQGMAALPSEWSGRILSDVNWTTDGKYILCGLYSSNSVYKTMRIYSFDATQGIATEIHVDRTTHVDNTGAMIYSIWTPKGDKCCVLYPLGAKYFKIDTSTNAVSTITWQDMFDVEPVTITDNAPLSISHGFKHIQYFHARGGTTVVNYVYDEQKDKFVKQPEIHADIKQILNTSTCVSFDKSEQYMFLHQNNTMQHAAICKFKEDTKEWELDTQQILMPNYTSIRSSYALNQKMYSLSEILVLFRSPTHTDTAPNETIQVWDMTGLKPSAMQITDEEGKVYHPETNSDIVLYKDNPLTDTVLSTASAISGARQELQTFNVANATDRNTYPKIYVQDTRPQAMNDGDFWINTK